MTDERLRGYRIGEHNGPYGPMLPLEMRMRRATARLRQMHDTPPQNMVVHPAVFQRWVDQGLIWPNGLWRRP